MPSKLGFCSEGMKTIQAIKITVMFRRFPVNNADSFLPENNAIVSLRLESLQEQLFFFTI